MLFADCCPYHYALSDAAESTPQRLELSIEMNDKEFWADLTDASSGLDALAAAARAEVDQSTSDTRIYLEQERAVGRRLRHQREASAMSQAEVAERMRALGFELQQSTVAKIESGKRPIRVAELFAFETVFGLPFQSLVMLPLPSAEEDETYISALRDRVRAASERKAQAERMMKDWMELASRQYAEAESSLLWLSHQLSESAARAARSSRGGGRRGSAKDSNN